MSILVWANNASTTIASAITNSQTTITLSAGTGAEFPTPSAGQIAIATLEDTSGDIEIVYITGMTGDVATVQRAQEGTTALAFASGSRFEQRPTAGTMQAFLQKNGGDTMTGTTNMTGVLALGSGGSIQGGEFTGYHRSAAGVTSGQMYVSAGTPMSGTSVILTNTNLVGNLPSGYDMMHSNMICFWAGSSGSIPTGWHLCDGTNGTPDLRDQFIVGGGGALPTSGTYNAATGSASAGTPTINPVTPAATNMPSHLHPFDYFFGNSSAVVGIPGFTAPSFYFAGNSGTGTRVSFAGSPPSGTIGQPFTPTAAAMAGHTHPQAIPYRAVFAIMKL
jgi:hypothetical protein